MFEDADAFDIARATDGAKPHLAFGMGVHHCIGSNLARAESRIAIETLYGRLPGLRMVAEQDIHQINPMLFRTWSGIEMEYNGPVLPRSTAAG